MVVYKSHARIESHKAVREAVRPVAVADVTRVAWLAAVPCSGRNDFLELEGPDVVNVVQPLGSDRCIASGERSVERQRMFGTLTYSSWAAQPARIESHKAVREAVRDADAAYRVVRGPEPRKR